MRNPRQCHLPPAILARLIVSAVVVLAVALVVPTSAHPSATAPGWGLADANTDLLRAHGRRLSLACADRGRMLSGCPLAPESTAGPFALDNGFVRTNITEGLPGVPFVLVVEVVNSSNCEPRAGLSVEVWHCDASGEYSGIDESTSTPNGETFLRGVQFTNETGFVRFESVFPGWYRSRTTHIHIRVHRSLDVEGVEYTGAEAAGTTIHTGQLYFEDDLCDDIGLLTPYSAHDSPRTARNDDGIYSRMGGDYGIVSTSLVDESSGYSAGVRGLVTVGVDDDASSLGTNSAPLARCTRCSLVVSLLVSTLVAWSLS